MGTSYRSRHVKSEYIFAGKTGTSQIRSITEEERELKLKQKDLPYKRRDHALFTHLHLTKIHDMHLALL